MNIAHHRFGIGLLPMMKIDPRAPGLRTDYKEPEQKPEGDGPERQKSGGNKKREGRKHDDRVAVPNKYLRLPKAQQPRNEKPNSEPNRGGARPLRDPLPKRRRKTKTDQRQRP